MDPPMREELVEDVTSLVKPAAVHRSLYDDPAIFELELDAFSAGHGFMSATKARCASRAIIFARKSGESRSSSSAVPTGRCMCCTTSAPTAAPWWSRSIKAD